MNIRRIQIFLAILVFFNAHLLAAQSKAVAPVTPPEKYLGFKPGADFKLASFAQAAGYFELLASQTGRMRIMDMGPTPMGRHMKYAVISSEGNLRKLDRYKEIAARLSLARGVGAAEADKMAAEGKAVVWIDGGLHATECAPAQHLMQLAYDLVTGEDESTRRIRENTVALLVFANPDGMDLVAEWYMKNVGTKYETSSLPWLYNKYIGHDNNRDSFNASQLETQNISRAQNHEWFPEVVYNHHQTAPFPARIYIPPYGEPTNVNKPPLVIRWENFIGGAMGKAFEEADKPGAISRAFFDAWYPGYVTQIVVTHNIPSILTETALYRYATPREYKVADFPEAYRDLTKSVFYPNPWKGGWWHLGDAVEYCLIASRAVLDFSARYSKDLLLSKYILASGIIEKYKSAPPYGWILPREQADANTMARMIDKLILLGVEVYEAREPFTDDSRQYPDGTYVIPVSQPFGMYVKTMLEIQEYPDLRKNPALWQGIVSPIRVDAAPLRPYDVAGWTLPIQMGVASMELKQPVSFKTALLPASRPPEGNVSGNEGAWIFSATDNNSYIAANRILRAGGKLRRATESFILDGKNYTPGAFLADGLSPSSAAAIARETHISMARGLTTVKAREMKPPRIGHYLPWTGSLDEGWIRWLLEQYEFPYTSLRDADFREGKLKAKADVIILADISSRSIVSGNQEGTMPPEYVGGMTEAGVQHLKEFVAAGGTLICNSASCALAIQTFGLPVKNVLDESIKKGFYIAGSLVRMKYDPTHPLTYGMQENGAAFFAGGMIFDVQGSAEGIRAAARFPDEPLLLSGYLEHDELVRGKATVLEVPFEKGRIVMFGFNFHNRAQAHATFKLLFNSLLYPRP
jgi:hypothetical protein